MLLEKTEILHAVLCMRGQQDALVGERQEVFDVKKTKVWMSAQIYKEYETIILS